MYLLRYELKKINKANYLIGSFMVMLLSPIFSLLLMSLNPHGFILGDFNKMNLIFLSLIGSKLIFPLTAMIMIKLEYDHKGWIGIFVTPKKRESLLIIKLFVSILWSILLVVFSLVVVLITELVLFGDMNVLNMINETAFSYVCLLVYMIPFIVFGMLLTFVMKQTVVPMIVMSFMVVIGYFMQLFNESLYLPSAIPKFISNGVMTSSIVLAYILLYAFGIVSFVVLRYVFRNKDY